LTKTYSIVIPAYNESARLRATIEKILAHMQARGWDAEIVVVNDGSSDDTASIVRSFSANNRAVRLVQNPGNRGKGYSVRNGMLHANGEIILFSDADLSSPTSPSDRAGSVLNCRLIVNRSTVSFTDAFSMSPCS
jgi:dolichyl-phosphate beta-glucosyltransferase